MYIIQHVHISYEIQIFVILHEFTSLLVALKTGIVYYKDE